MKKRVLCLLVDGFEEIETITPIDVLRRAGVEVVIASVRGGVATSRSGIRIEPDADLAEVASEHFHMLFIPGGPGVAALRSDGRSAELAREFYDSGHFLAAICAAPLVLNDAKLLTGRRFTCHFSAHAELPDALPDRVVVDGKLITSRGAGTALDFGLALVESLAGKAAADEVSTAIMA